MYWYKMGEEGDLTLKGMEVSDDGDVGQTTFHPCDELPRHPKYIIPDNDCLTTIVSRYILDPRLYLGHGMYGHVFRLLDSETDSGLAVKVLPYEDPNDQNVAYGELRVACELNDLKDETSAFQTTFGWLVCNEMPSGWIDRIPQNNALRCVDQFIFIFMEAMNDPFTSKQYRFTKDQLLTLFWASLHGLAIARLRLGFYHNDIHSGNVMFSIIGPHNNVATYGVSSTRRVKVIFDQNVVVKFIDFGNSCVDAIGCYTKHNDVLTLMRVFQERARIDNIDGELFDNNAVDAFFQHYKHTDSSSLFRFLWEYEPFKHVWTLKRKRIKKKQLATEKCIFCINEANVKWEGTTLWFCSNRCASRVGCIADVLPREE